MVTYKSIVKSTLVIIGLLFSSSLFANSFTGLDIKTINQEYNFQENKYDSNSLFPLENKNTIEQKIDRIVPPLYEGETLLLKVSTDDILEYPSLENDLLTGAVKEAIVSKSNYISIVLTMTF